MLPPERVEEFERAAEEARSLLEGRVTRGADGGGGARAGPRPVRSVRSLVNYEAAIRRVLEAATAG